MGFPKNPKPDNPPRAPAARPLRHPRSRHETLAPCMASQALMGAGTAVPVKKTGEPTPLARAFHVVAFEKRASDFVDLGLRNKPSEDVLNALAAQADAQVEESMGRRNSRLKAADLRVGGRTELELVCEECLDHVWDPALLEHLDPEKFSAIVECAAPLSMPAHQRLKVATEVLGRVKRENRVRMVKQLAHVQVFSSKPGVAVDEEEVLREFGAGVNRRNISNEGYNPLIREVRREGKLQHKAWVKKAGAARTGAAASPERRPATWRHPLRDLPLLHDGDNAQDSTLLIHALARSAADCRETTSLPLVEGRKRESRYDKIAFKEFFEDYGGVTAYGASLAEKPKALTVQGYVTRGLQGANRLMKRMMLRA